MRPSLRNEIRRTSSLFGGLVLAAALLPAGAQASETATESSRATALGQLKQPAGSRGCVVDRAARTGTGKGRRSPCSRARALRGPGPFLGSRALALSPGGGGLYVASSKSDAITIFERDRRSGALSQPQGTGGCIAAEGAHGCTTAFGLDGPNSVAVSPDGRNVYATSRASSSVAVFRRNRSTGALRQPTGIGCISSEPLPDCTAGRALQGADVVTVSPDGENVYVGAFFGSAVVTFDRDPSNGALTQPSDESGCITNKVVAGCTTGLALGSPEGMAVSGDGANVYVGSAASSALVALERDPDSGVLTQATDGSGCIVNRDLDGCTTGAQLGGANAVELSPDDEDVYVTSLLSNSVTSFSRPDSSAITQKPGTQGCLVYLLAVGCSLGEALSAPEGLALSPDGANLYAVAFDSAAVTVLDRDPDTGAVVQKPGRAGCLSRKVPNCSRGRRLRGVSSIVVSQDGRHAYASSFGSDALAVFRRNTSE